MKQIRHYIGIRYGIQLEEIFWARKVLCDACCIGWSVFCFTPFLVLWLYQHTRWVCGPNTINNKYHHFVVMLVISSDWCDIIKYGVDYFHARVLGDMCTQITGSVPAAVIPLKFSFFVFSASLLPMRRNAGRTGSSSMYFMILFLLVAKLARKNCVTGLGAVRFVPLTVLLEVFVGFSVL